MPYSNKEKKSEYDKKRYQLNKEKRAEYYRVNKEKKAEYNKEYNERNKEKIREERREQHKEKRAICLEYLGGKCVKCGTIHNLQFDHIKREGKKYEISAKLSYKFDNLKEELDKCQLLCYDCHKIKTKSERTILCKMKPTQRGD